MNRLVLMLAAVIAAPLSVAAQGSAATEMNMGSFSAKPDTVRNSPNVDVDIVLVIETDNARHYRLDQRVTDQQGSVTRALADSRSCPAVLEQLSKVEDMPVPSFVAPGSKRGRSAQMIMHPTTYTLAMDGYESTSRSSADLKISAPSGSPLARWVEETLAALKPCWSPQGN